jgi:hypothetical protein
MQRRHGPKIHVPPHQTLPLIIGLSHMQMDPKFVRNQRYAKKHQVGGREKEDK